VHQALSSFISLSTLGNLLSGQFSQGRGLLVSLFFFSRWRYSILVAVIQELGREGIIPYSAFFASNKPFNAPLAGLFTQYLVSCTFLFAVPPGDAYLFLISRMSSLTWALQWEYLTLFFFSVILFIIPHQHPSVIWLVVTVFACI